MDDQATHRVTLQGMISIEGVTDDPLLRTIHETVDADRAICEMHTMGDLVPPAMVTSDHPEVIRHYIKKYIAMTNQEAAYRRLPESPRRKDERRQRRRAETKQVLQGVGLDVLSTLDMTGEPNPQCVICGGRGWWEDEDLNQRDCEACRP